MRCRKWQAHRLRWFLKSGARARRVENDQSGLEGANPTTEAFYLGKVLETTTKKL